MSVNPGAFGPMGPQPDKELEQALEVLEKGPEGPDPLAEAIARIPNKPEPQNAITVPGVCQKCKKNEAHHTCVKCHGLTCIACRADADPTFCRECLTSNDINLRQEPLKDDEGVTHDGRHLFPDGSAFKTLPEIISEMTDKALSAYIDLMKMKVKEAERVIDYRRVALATATLENEERGQLAKRKLRGMKVISSNIQKVVTGSKTKPVAAAAAPKLTPEMIQGFMAKLSPKVRAKLEAEMAKLSKK